MPPRGKSRRVTVRLLALGGRNNSCGTARTKRNEIPLKLERRSAWRNRAEYVSFR